MKEGEQHFEGKIHQNAIITTKDGQKILIVRDPNDPELWELPGGRLNIGEKPIDGLKREIMEELGIDVEVGFIYHTQFIWHERAQRENFLIMYEVFVPNEDVELNIDPEEVAEVMWVDKYTYKDIKMFKDANESIEAYFDKKR